jgi:23S rRNA (guanine2445-N2)-methyltransferase / 23S rRNA (guanine2069-N7)-methyltransferase
MKKFFLLFATCPKGLEGILYQELVTLGARELNETRAGVHFRGSLETAYRVCLWSRLANRLLLPMERFAAGTTDDLYDRVLSLVNWHDHMETDGYLAVDFTASSSRGFHSHYAALRVKDAIVDQFNKRFGRRPSVDTLKPDIRVNVHMKQAQATLSLDLSGDSLHRRGYRSEGGIAPLKENLAAAILIRAGWPDIALRRGTLIDPMCGSGTLLLEGAMLAFDMAPGLGRRYFGFSKWKQHDEVIWQNLLEEAIERKERGLDGKKPVFLGFDADKHMIVQAKNNASRAGLLGFIQFHCRDLEKLKGNRSFNKGLVIANPPYGERMGEKASLASLYHGLGERLKAGFYGWQASVFTANPDLAKHMGIRAKKQYRFFNGALPCKLLNFEIHDSWYMRKTSPGRVLSEQERRAVPDSGAEMFANRVRKNQKSIGKWARREGITCYRLYDADMPEYAVAIDMYHDWAHVQEYQAPAGVPPENSKRRLAQIMSSLPGVLKTAPEKIVLKVRKRNRGKEQYEKFDSSGRFFEVKENGLSFLVNLVDYVDTGLFLDHRITRELIKKYAAGKRVLNLFAYTGTATVYAAAGGAETTTSVDMSRTYVSWAGKNLELNGFDKGIHKIVQAECLAWTSKCNDKYDLIFLGPPTFSNSRRMKWAFDIQRDHIQLLKTVLGLLAHDGLLIFSSNYRKFKLNKEALAGWNIKDITRDTIPRDFQRNTRIHQCFEIRN